MGLGKALIAGGIVVVRSHRFSHSPIRHGQLGIELGGAFERARGLVVIEGVDQAQSLIEELLRLRIPGGDGMMQVSQSGHQRGRLRLSVNGMTLSRDYPAQQQGE